MPGLATKADYARLATEQGLPADIDFSKLMINHHEAGIEMADYAAANGSNGAVRELARKMAKTQRFEIHEMNLASVPRRPRGASLSAHPDARLSRDMHIRMLRCGYA